MTATDAVKAGVEAKAAGEVAAGIVEVAIAAAALAAAAGTTVRTAGTAAAGVGGIAVARARVPPTGAAGSVRAEAEAERRAGAPSGRNLGNERCQGTFILGRMESGSLSHRCTWQPPRRRQCSMRPFKASVASMRVMPATA